MKMGAGACQPDLGGAKHQAFPNVVKRLIKTDSLIPSSGIQHFEG